MSDEIHTVKLISITPDAEKIIATTARTCYNPKNVDVDIANIIKICVEGGHWSVFEQANMTLQFKTTRAISHQLVRHRSMSFIQQSQRYCCDEVQFHFSDGDTLSTVPPNTVIEWMVKRDILASLSKEYYNWAISKGISRDCARDVLLECAETTVTANGTIRSWIHYIKARAGSGAQVEHKKIAIGARDIFDAELPIISKALETEGVW